MAAARRLIAPYSGPFDTTHRFVTSWFLPPAALFAIRTTIALYAFTTFFTIFGWNGAHRMSDASGKTFSYFTHLTNWGIAFYFAFSAMHTLSYWLTGSPFLARWPRALQIAHSMFYSTVVVYAFVVTIVYWAILAPSGFRSTFSLWTNVSHHALNSVFALFEIVCPRTAPLPWLDLIPIVMGLALYLALAYVTHATQGFYTYGFLDLQEHSSGIVAAYIIGILVAGIIIFLIVRYVIVLRVWVIETKLGKMGKFSSHAPRRTLHEGEADAELAEKGVRVDDVATK